MPGSVRPCGRTRPSAGRIETPELAYYYPTSVLITSRDIISLWVARMVITGLYNVGQVPFHEVFIHPKILDGYGEGCRKRRATASIRSTSSRSSGRSTAFRHRSYNHRDARRPHAGRVECPHCQKLIEQTKENRIRPRIKCQHCGKELSTQWAEKEADKALPRGAVVSERFELGRNSTTSSGTPRASA